MAEIRILLVEDEAITAMDIRTSLEELGYLVPATASSGAEAIRMADEIRPDLILMDITLSGDMNGIEAARQIRRELHIPIIFLTAHIDSHTLAQAKTVEPFGYLSKPASLDNLKNTIEVALYKSAADARVRESEARYRTLVECSPVGIAISRKGKFCYLNPAALQLFGAKEEADLVGRDILDIVHPDFHALVQQRIARVLATGIPSPPYEERLIRLDGTEIIVEISGLSIAYQGRPAVQATFRDITAQKQAEKKIQELNTHLEDLVAERTAELVQTNRDLHNFCYAISHELRAPVARLQGFSQLLQEVSAADHPAEAQHCAERIAAASHLLQEVIDAVLQLSRLGKMSIVPQPLDLSNLAREVASELVNSTPDRQLEVTIADGLRAGGDSQLLRLCLANLLGNALKFTARQPLARIEFGLDTARSALFVRDNGIGFDMAHAGKLFEPFLRLHSTHEFAGTGIGLALVQRIIELHGGRIWTEAAPDQGATFFFTLASMQQADPTPLLSDHNRRRAEKPLA